MRTQKRFTPDLLDRFKRLGRGTGTYEEYVPWHRVGRSDPGSLGRSHLMMWRKRQRELLSDGEMSGALFMTMLNNLADAVEQFPLAEEDGVHELARYDIRHTHTRVPGTISISRRLNIRHPRVNGNGRSRRWCLTTDQLLVLKLADGTLEMLAVSFKPAGLRLTKRAYQLLALEQAYWAARSVQWILITPELFDETAADCLWRAAPWALGDTVDPHTIELAAAIVSECLGYSLTFTLDSLSSVLGNLDFAQRAFWQGVWSGAIPMDLRRGWRPHLPVNLIDTQCFLDLNPIARRRSAWI